MRREGRGRIRPVIAGVMLVAGLVLVPATARAQDGAAPRYAAYLDQANAILERHPVFDGHNDVVWEIRTNATAPMDVAAYDLEVRTPGDTDIPRLQAGHVGAQFWSVYTPGEVPDSGYARLQLEEIDIARRMIDAYPELELALTAADVERIMAEGRIASLIGVEGGHAIENSLGVLRAYYDLGARYMTLTHNVTLEWADAAEDTARSGGLSSFGEAVVHEMNRLGMLVDLAHVSDATMSDALNVSQAPVIFSHSSARAVTPGVPRNVPDSILARMPANGGVVMVTFVPSFVNAEVAAYGKRLSHALDSLVVAGASREQMRQAYRSYTQSHPAPHATVEDVADHVEHVRRVAGIDHIGIGSDFDGMGPPPEGLGDVSAYPNLFAELLRRGWTEEDLAKLADGNILRVMREAEAVSRRLRSAESPSAARLPLPR